MGTQSLEFQNLVVVIIRKPVWYLQKARHIEQSRPKNPEIVPTNMPICVLKRVLKQFCSRELDFVPTTAI